MYFRAQVVSGLFVCVERHARHRRLSVAKSNLCFNGAGVFGVTATDVESVVQTARIDHPKIPQPSVS